MGLLGNISRSNKEHAQTIKHYMFGGKVPYFPWDTPSVSAFNLSVSSPRGTLRCSERTLVRGTCGQAMFIVLFLVQRGDEDSFFTGISWELGIQWDFSWGFDGNFMVLKRDLMGI